MFLGFPVDHVLSGFAKIKESQENQAKPRLRETKKTKQTKKTSKSKKKVWFLLPRGGLRVYIL